MISTSYFLASYCPRRISQAQSHCSVQRDSKSICWQAFCCEAHPLFWRGCADLAPALVGHFARDIEGNLLVHLRPLQMHPGGSQGCVSWHGHSCTHVTWTQRCRTHLGWWDPGKLVLYLPIWALIPSLAMPFTWSISNAGHSLSVFGFQQPSAWVPVDEAS